MRRLGQADENVVAVENEMEAGIFTRARSGLVLSRLKYVLMFGCCKLDNPGPDATSSLFCLFMSWFISPTTTSCVGVVCVWLFGSFFVWAITFLISNGALQMGVESTLTVVGYSSLPLSLFMLCGSAFNIYGHIYVGVLFRFGGIFVASRCAVLWTLQLDRDKVLLPRKHLLVMYPVFLLFQILY